MSATSAIQKYNEQFVAALDLLNDRQSAAVNATEGPVLVIAGPGTGKTHILTARIGKILLETDAQAHNILCLTFTDAGVQAMRKRLLEFIGPEAHRVHIFTFHSFCNGIIQDNLELFGRHDLEPVSDLEKVEILEEILGRMPTAHPLRRGRGGDIYFYVPHLDDLFRRMKEENWSPEYLERKIDDYLADLPRREDYIYKRNTKDARKGDLKTVKFAAEQEKMNRLRAAVQLFPEYLTEMRRRRRYDYADMILWVVKSFDENEALLRTYQEQYLYFLVDEFQDTNGAQNEILQHLIRYWQNPNIFIVGDDDQSIYEFQGARLKNLTDFHTQYENDLELVVLRDNYRSSQVILDTARTLIEHNQKRIINSAGLTAAGIDKYLRAQTSEGLTPAVLPVIAAYPDHAQEEADIIAQIEKLRDDGCPLEEIAVVYAKHRQSANLINLLEKKGIPYQTKRRVNILDLPLIRRLRTLLTYFQAEYTLPYSGEDLLYKILYFDFLEMNLGDLAKISLYQAKRDYAERQPWRDLLSDAATLAKIQLTEPEKCLSFARLLNELLSDFANLPVPRFIEKLLNRTGLLRHILGAEDKVWLLRVVHTFLAYVREETERNPKISVGRLLEIFKKLDKNRISLQVQTAHGNHTGVQLLTAHGSKGLEFRAVFILDAAKDVWEGGKRGNNYRFSFPDTVTLSGEADAEEARRRLFYVAVTRAKEFLHISYAAKDKKDKERQRTIFLDEILQNAGLEITRKQAASDRLLEAQILLLTEAEQPAVTLPAAADLAALLEGFQLSVSAMNQYLRCPVAFYYENVLRVPTVQSEAASYGTAMHNALQRLFERMSQNEKKRFPKLSEFIEIFDFEMSNLRGYFRPQNYRQNLQRGRENLAAYYKKNLSEWSRKALTEKSIVTEVDGVPIKGVIDRLNFIGANQATVTDYKTGARRSRKVQKPTPAEPHGGIYWRQLYFYKILYENYRNTPVRVLNGEISYLDPDARGEYLTDTVLFEKRYTDKVKSMIRNTYQSILNHEFAEGCGEERCEWCRFLREGKAVTSFRDKETEELDD